MHTNINYFPKLFLNLPDKGLHYLIVAFLLSEDLMSNFKIFFPFFAMLSIAGVASYYHIVAEKPHFADTTEFTRDINDLKTKTKVSNPESPLNNSAIVFDQNTEEEKQNVIDSIFALQKREITSAEKKEQEVLRANFQKQEKYEILVVILPTRKEAIDFISTNQLQSFKPRISPSLQNGKRMFGIHVGGFEKKEDAEKLKQKIEIEKYMKVSILGL